MKTPNIISRKTPSICIVWRVLGKKIISEVSFMIHYAVCISSAKSRVNKILLLNSFSGECFQLNFITWIDATTET